MYWLWLTWCDEMDFVNARGVVPWWDLQNVILLATVPLGLVKCRKCGDLVYWDNLNVEGVDLVFPTLSVYSVCTTVLRVSCDWLVQWCESQYICHESLHCVCYLFFYSHFAYFSHLLHLSATSLVAAVEPLKILANCIVWCFTHQLRVSSGEAGPITLKSWTHPFYLNRCVFGVLWLAWQWSPQWNCILCIGLHHQHFLRIGSHTPFSTNEILVMDRSASGWE